MASSSSSTALASRLNLNLVIDSAAEKVLYAVVGKDFLDFLFSLMQMQVAPLARALGRDQAKGCLGMLYDSLEGFSTDYMLPKVDKAQTLKPALPTNRPTQTRTLLMLRYDGQAPSVGAAPGTGWVKGGDTVYMVTDDLAVAPFDTGAVLRRLRSVTDIHAVDEKTVEFGSEEALSLIRTCLHSRSVFTDIYCGKDK